ncbi:hypothetical protein RJ639_047036 [Escallonia herrerae]|uniref:F-box associated beta-propeller type 3 domain-containing protein n=1 Tax=Escallonia herrerae TaxID=1293975 RepID=A0AA88W748_9ASTE|nr:hypothetical protein RJ639_047036 [Escallonia herrerae]
MDALALLDGRTYHLKIMIGDVKDRVWIVEQNLRTLEEHVFEELETLKRAVDAQDELCTRFIELFVNLQEQLDGLKVGMEETRQDTTMCKLFFLAYDFSDVNGRGPFSLRGEGNSGSWRDAGNCPFRVFEISSPACINGVIYWLARDKDHLENKILMISPEFEKENFSSVRYPYHISSIDFMEFILDELSLVELKGCLCLVDNSSENLITDVWTLKDAKNQTWVKEYSIAFGTLNDSVTVCYNPMDVRDGEILLEASPGNEGRQGRLYFYNVEKRPLERQKTKRLQETGYLLKSLHGVALSSYDAPGYVTEIIRLDQRKLKFPLVIEHGNFACYGDNLSPNIQEVYNATALRGNITLLQMPVRLEMGNMFDTTQKDVIVRESKEIEVKSMVEIKEALDPPDNLPPIYLPTDILINIFSRLSVKILCSCKCVSKAWHQEFLQLPKHCGQCNEKSAGFGFLESRNEYRIASLLSRPNNDDTELWCEIFDLKEGEGNSGFWRDAGKCPFRIFEMSSPACVNGVIYWLARDKDHPDNKILMISLDLEKEEFSTVRHPDHYLSMDSLEFSLDQLSLVELNGCLCFVDNSSENLITDVWTLKDPKNQTWVKEYSIGFGALDNSVTMCCSCNPMDVRDGEILLEASPGDEGRQGRLYFYNIEKKTFRTTEDVGWQETGYLFKSLRWIAPSPYDAPLYIAEIIRLDQRKLALPLVIEHGNFACYGDKLRSTLKRKRWMNVTNRNRHATGSMYNRVVEYLFTASDKLMASAPPLSLTSPYDPLGLHIIQSCNGLLLLCSQDHRNKFVDYVTLWRARKPSMYLGFGVMAILRQRIGFDPLKSIFYKIVCVYNKLISPYNQVEIYSSMSRAWRGSWTSIMKPMYPMTTWK